MLKNIQEQWQQEQDEYLSYLLNNRFFKIWKAEEEGFDSYASLEIYLTSFCNQKCEYCYLKNNNGIYPEEFNKKETIIKNYRILLDYLVKNKYYFNKIEFFSGDIWHTSYGLEILEIFQEYLEKGLRCKILMIPSNGYFVSKYETLMPIQRLINIFKYKYDVRLSFSLSIDGKIVEDLTRPLENTEQREDEYYNNLFSFAKENRFYFHPMISSFGINKWEENYEWWKKMCQLYDINLYEWVMFLEVRNNDWTEDNIKKYNDLIEKMLSDFYTSDYIKCDNSKLMNLLLDSWKDDEHSIENYFPFLLPSVHNNMPCTVDKDLTVRIGDLAICPCHRLAYSNNLYGYFKTNDKNEIIGVTAKNTEIATRILLGNNNICSLKCDTCIYNKLCLKGCFGAQKETNNDPFLPIESICDLFQNKVKTILTWLNKHGIIEMLYNLNADHVGWEKAKILLLVWEHIQNEKKN